MISGEHELRGVIANECFSLAENEYYNFDSFYSKDPIKLFDLIKNSNQTEGYQVTEVVVYKTTMIGKESKRERLSFRVYREGCGDIYVSVKEAPKII